MQKEKKEKHFVRRPAYPGGPKAMREFLKQHLRYPEEAMRNGIEGTVAIRYEVDYKGNVADVEILTSVGYGCDEEAIRLARLLKFDVPPTRGLKVTFHNTLKVHFHLPKTNAQTIPPPQLQYNYVSSSIQPDKEDNGPKVNPGSYSYTITIG